MFAEDPIFNEKMKEAAEASCLAGHVSGVHKKNFVHGPGDIEGHRGTDGKYYVCGTKRNPSETNFFYLLFLKIDFGRLLPPEEPSLNPTQSTRKVFFSLLRPELVRYNAVPLCSDAFSAWNSDPNVEQREAHNDAVLKSVIEISKKFFTHPEPQNFCTSESFQNMWKN